MVCKWHLIWHKLASQCVCVCVCAHLQVYMCVFMDMLSVHSHMHTGMCHLPQTPPHSPPTNTHIHSRKLKCVSTKIDAQPMFPNRVNWIPIKFLETKSLTYFPLTVQAQILKKSQAHCMCVCVCMCQYIQT